MFQVSVCEVAANNAPDISPCNIIGGEISDYTKMMAESREQSIDRMIEEAENKGANAIVGILFTTSMVMQGASEFLAYGTAVVVE